jgi:hypothetical protein
MAVPALNCKQATLLAKNTPGRATAQQTTRRFQRTHIRIEPPEDKIQET